jgi:Helicase conserved C-terminal domain
MFRLLRADAGVAMLRARGAAVAGGALTRQEALSRFAPLAQGAPQPAAAERIDLLLTTDLLSEGVNLQDASVVVHLDLPWNPARLEQRVGRVSRIGSPHLSVAVYALRPPAPAERLLAVERRLREKIAAASRSVGVVGAILPGLGGATSERSAAEDWSRVHARLRAWQTMDGAPAAPSRSGDEVRPLVAAVESGERGFVAGLKERGAPVLLASLGGAPSTVPSIVARAMEHAAGADRTVDERALDAALRAIEAWAARRAASALSGIDGSAVARARRHVLSRITSAASRAPRHLRSVYGPLAADARRAALMPLGEGAERILAELADAPLPDEAWLRAVAAFGAVHARGSSDKSGHGPPGCALVALLLLQQ